MVSIIYTKFAVIIDLERISTGLVSTHASAVTKSADMLNKNTLGAKKLQGQSEAAIKWLYMRPKCVISG